jgi:hypothetical protein
MTQIHGRFRHLIYSPRGGIEGVLLELGDGPAQVVFDKHDDESPLAFEHLHDGDELVVDVTPAEPSAKGEADHPVYDYGRIVSIKGVKPAKRRPASGAAYKGVVARLNYARHGAANGVVLDTGDFIHTRPDAMARLGLKVGDFVEADGDAQMLSTGNGWAVEATKVNRKAIR